MSSIKRTTSTRSREYKKGIADSGRGSKIESNYQKKLAARKDTRRERLAKRRCVWVPWVCDIRCKLDKFYEEVNAMHQQFGQQQQSTNTFGLGGGRRKRRSSKLKRRPRRSSKLKRTSRRSSKLKRRNN